MANELDFLFTPGYQTSYDDPDGSKHRAASSIEISGKPGTIEKTLGMLPEGIVPKTGMKSTAVLQREQQQANLAQQNAEVDYLNSLFYSPPSPETNPEMGEISKGVSRGWAQTKSDFAAFGGTLALLGGAEDTANSAFQKAQELADEAKKYPAAISRVEDAFESPGSFVNWAAGMIGEQIPVIASIVAGGGAGGLVGRLVAKGVVSKVAAEQATAKIAQWGLRGATTGVIAGTTAMEGGGMTMEQIEAGVPVTPGTNVLLGSAAGAAEAVSPVLLARMLGLKLPMATRFADHITSTMATKGLLARMGTGAGVIAGVEGGTEAFQEALAIAARSFADENYDTLGPETASRILNAVAGGVLVGGLFGGVGGIRKQPLAAQETPESEPQLALPPPQLQLPAPTPIGPTDQGGGTGGGTAMPAAPETSMFANIREGQGLTPEPTILFTENGKESLDPDAIMARTAEITEALSLPEMRTPMQQALLRQVENQRLADFKRLFEMKAPSPTLGKLMSLRSTLMEAENVSPAVEAKIDKMSKMIDELATKEEIELPKSNYLSDKENARLAYLIEKDRTDGLSHKEIDSLEKLSAKAGGEKVATRVPATEANVAKLEAEVEEAMKGEGPLYRDSAGTSMTGLSPEEFTKIISGIHNPNIPIDVMEHPAQLRDAPELQKYIMKSGRKVHGAYTNGKIHFFSRNMTAANAVKVYLHEVAHYGLHNVLPADVLKGIL